MARTILTWHALDAVAASSRRFDRATGPTNAQATLRLFGRSEADAARVILYRDHHAWCPYCQKVWLWLEFKRVPYTIRKVTMFCYGNKETWYKALVPSGMLPALSIDGRMITESDVVLEELEKAFGPLAPGQGMRSPPVAPLRQLERRLFRVWCDWLCYPSRTLDEDTRRGDKFDVVASEVDTALRSQGGPYFLGSTLSIADLVFTPYIERMHASLYYYKGYDLRQRHTSIDAWFAAMATNETYLGTQSDFHTHAHDLPPQMGGCFASGSADQQAAAHRVDRGPWFGLPDATHDEPEGTRLEALSRVIAHAPSILAVNVDTDKGRLDTALRCALTLLSAGGGEGESAACVPPPGSALGLRYLRDRINVPRDMSIYAAKHLRTALEATAAMDSDVQPSPLPVENRRDQDPRAFGH